MPKLNGSGDLAFDAHMRPYIGTEVVVLKITKGGLYYVQTHDGRFLSVPKRNLDGLEPPTGVSGAAKSGAE